eukprot:scaffold33_cov135-Pinguiococcus_pyrenoidosus.AAC.5
MRPGAGAAECSGYPKESGPPQSSMRSRGECGDHNLRARRRGVPGPPSRLRRWLQLPYQLRRRRRRQRQPLPPPTPRCCQRPSEHP